ncbi:hypothetical protein BpHYR1_002445 [Brachionus plicatilis]|uniref:Uncharacterized protein n=1 Tax=Brachionus plicatilis TaxID=10195 RepID=A0A3M7QXP8_BRAPC|nr:hypothetical protein BpHYR1_002445 [Brachionus plicatilis]
MTPIDLIFLNSKNDLKNCSHKENMITTKNEYFLTASIILILLHLKSCTVNSTVRHFNMLATKIMLLLRVGLMNRLVH